MPAGRPWLLTRCRPRSDSCPRWKSEHPASWFEPMRNVIVTGASRGLGLAISHALVAAGYQVIAVARTQSAELLADFESAPESAAGRLSFRACDLSRTAELGNFVGSLRKEFGP